MRYVKSQAPPQDVDGLAQSSDNISPVESDVRRHSARVAAITAGEHTVNEVVELFIHPVHLGSTHGKAENRRPRFAPNSHGFAKRDIATRWLGMTPRCRRWLYREQHRYFWLRQACPAARSSNAQLSGHCGTIELNQ